MDEENDKSGEVNGGEPTVETIKTESTVNASEDISEEVTHESLLETCKQQRNQICLLEEKLEQMTNEKSSFKERLQQKTSDYDKMEHLLLTNFNIRDAEIQDLVHQNEELKGAMSPASQQLRCMCLDPAVNIVFQRLKKEAKEYKEKMEQTQNDLQAWKFTPDSQNGKRMMNRIRVLLQENEELGKMNQSGKTAKLETEIAMKKKLTDELLLCNNDLEDLIVDMDSETDALQNTVFVLQQQLVALQQELDTLRPGASRDVLARVANNAASDEEPETIADGEVDGAIAAANGNDYPVVQSTENLQPSNNESGGGGQDCEQPVEAMETDDVVNGTDAVPEPAISPNTNMITTNSDTITPIPRTTRSRTSNNPSSDDTIQTNTPTTLRSGRKKAGLAPIVNTASTISHQSTTPTVTQTSAAANSAS